MSERSDCHFRSFDDDIRMRGAKIGRGALRDRRLYRRGLLVYRLDILRQPAVTLARAYSDTFAGIAPSNVPGFVLAQCIGTLAAIALASWFWKMAPAKSVNSQT
jgi:hypothetical protein